MINSFFKKHTSREFRKRKPIIYYCETQELRKKSNSNYVIFLIKKASKNCKKVNIDFFCNFEA